MKKIKKHLKVEGMHCSSCAMMIEFELEDIGVTAKCSYAAQSVDVEYEDGKVTDTDLIAAVKKAGYTLVS